MPSQAELHAAVAAVRTLIDARAGWYAPMISDDMVKEVGARRACRRRESARHPGAPDTAKIMKSIDFEEGEPTWN